MREECVRPKGEKTKQPTRSGVLFASDFSSLVCAFNWCSRGKESDLSMYTNEFHRAERRLKQQQQACLQNYLLSIQLDSLFVKKIRARHSYLPVYANLRNGLWYQFIFEPLDVLK